MNPSLHCSQNSQTDPNIGSYTTGLTHPLGHLHRMSWSGGSSCCLITLLNSGRQLFLEIEGCQDSCGSGCRSWIAVVELRVMRSDRAILVRAVSHLLHKATIP